MDKDNRIRIGLWKKNGQYGQYLSGSLKTSDIPQGEYWINIYNNTNKKSDNSPDANIVLTPKEAKQNEIQDIAPTGFAAITEDIPF